MQNVSDELNGIQGRFELIMEVLEATAMSTFGVWDGAGEQPARANNDDFNSKFDEVQNVFRDMIGANDEVTGQMVDMHARLNKTFEM
jgi:hypothetical protein